jgi:hypothetical protein
VPALGQHHDQLLRVLALLVRHLPNQTQANGVKERRSKRRRP